MLVEGPYPANALTDADTNPISDIMVNIEFGSKDKFRKKTFLPNDLLTTLFLEQHLAFHGSAKKNKPFFSYLETFPVLTPPIGKIHPFGIYHFTLL